MYALQEEPFSNKQPSTWVLFDLSIPGAAERLHRERAAWQEQSDIEAIDKNHFVLIVYAGGARRLAS
jgi:hypothetical protein